MDNCYREIRCRHIPRRHSHTYLQLVWATDAESPTTTLTHSTLSGYFIATVPASSQDTNLNGPPPCAQGTQGRYCLQCQGTGQCRRGASRSSSRRWHWLAPGNVTQFVYTRFARFDTIHLMNSVNVIITINFKDYVHELVPSQYSIARISGLPTRRQP